MPLIEALGGIDSMKLVLPSSKYHQSYISYIKELGDEVRYPFTLNLSFNNFEQLLVQLKSYSLGENLPDDSVPNTTLWLVEGLNIIGVSNVRHHLNSRIENCGGHIGLGIRPSYRGKGLGNYLMQLSIKYLHDLGVKPVHIHCYKNNISSAKAIKNNCGVLNSEFNDNNKVIQRYLVNTTYKPFKQD